MDNSKNEWISTTQMTHKHNIEKTKPATEDYRLYNPFIKASGASLLTMVRLIEVPLLSGWGLQGHLGASGQW